MKFTVTVEETRSKDVVIEAADWEEAFEKVERAYLDGDIDMRTPDVYRTCNLGSEEHQFFEIYNW